MSRFRLFAVIALTVLVTALVMGALNRPVHADAPRTASCISQVPIGKDGSLDDRANTAVSGWMTAELAAGHTQFMVVPVMPATGKEGFCAW